MSSASSPTRRGFARFAATVSLMVGAGMGAALITFPKSKVVWISFIVLVFIALIADWRRSKPR